MPVQEVRPAEPNFDWQRLMNALILSDNPKDALAVKVMGMVASRLGADGLQSASYDDFEANGFHDPADLGIVILAADSGRSFDVLRQVRQTIGAPVMAVGQIGDPKLILRALQSGADYF